MTMDQQKPALAVVAPPQKQNFLNEVYTELTKTTWPTRQEALRLTNVVIGIIIVLGLYMAVLDFALGAIFSRILHH